MYYYVYKVTNLQNNKYYIGVHQTKNINDGYLGSGKIIKQAVKRYGINMFKKDILHLCNTRKEMFQREREIVDEQILKDPLCYNLILGGNDAYKNGKCGVTQVNKARNLYKWVYINDGFVTTCIKSCEVEKYYKLGWKKGNLSLSQKAKGRKTTPQTKKKLSKTLTGSYLLHKCNIIKRVYSEKDLDKHLSSGWKRGMSDYIKDKRREGGKYKNKSGSKNSSFGKRLINNPKTGEHKRVSNFEEYIRNGWKLGWIQNKELRSKFASRS